MMKLLGAWDPSLYVLMLFSFHSSCLKFIFSLAFRSLPRVWFWSLLASTFEYTLMWCFYDVLSLLMNINIMYMLLISSIFMCFAMFSYSYFPLQLWMMLAHFGVCIMGSMLVWISSWYRDFSYLDNLFFVFILMWCCFPFRFDNLLNALVVFTTYLELCLPLSWLVWMRCCHLLTCDHMVIICDVLNHV